MEINDILEILGLLFSKTIENRIRLASESIEQGRAVLIKTLQKLIKNLPNKSFEKRFGLRNELLVEWTGIELVIYCNGEMLDIDQLYLEEMVSLIEILYKTLTEENRGIFANKWESL